MQTTLLLRETNDKCLHSFSLLMRLVVSPCNQKDIITDIVQYICKNTVCLYGVLPPHFQQYFSCNTMFPGYY